MFPDLSFNYLHPARTTPSFPQNLLRPTNKGCGEDCDCGPCKGDQKGALGMINASGLGGLARVAMRPLAGLGQTDNPDTAIDGRPEYRTASIVLSVVATVCGAIAAYHGYKRNNSVGWGIAWYFLGAWFPFITLPVAFAQGYGERARGTRGVGGFNGKMRRALKRAKKRSR